MIINDNRYKRLSEIQVLILESRSPQDLTEELLGFSYSQEEVWNAIMQLNRGVVNEFK